MENEIKHGLNPLERDKRDLVTGALFELPKLIEIEKNFFTQPVSIKDQNADLNFDFCAGCAGTGLREPKEGVELFYPFLWAAAKFESGNDVNSFGVDLRSVGKALCKWGIPEMTDVPDSVKNLPPDQRRIFANYTQSVRDAALKHKAQTYMFVDGPYDDFDNARAHLWKFRDVQQQILFGVQWSWDLSAPELTLPGTQQGGGHAMWLSGAYDEQWLQCTNSAGKSAGVNGQHKISRDAYNKFASVYGALIIVDMPREDVQHMIDNKIKLGDNWMTQFLKILWTIVSSWLLTNKEKAQVIRDTTAEMNKIADVIAPQPVPIAPIIAPCPVPAPVVAPVVTGYKWDTPADARHSTRVICDEMKLSLASKDIICAVIMGESEFNIKAVGKPNTNGTRDWGICQINDHVWIGPGKLFASTDEVLSNPEKSVRFMIDAYKNGNIKWWCAYVNKSYLKFLPK